MVEAWLPGDEEVRCRAAAFSGVRGHLARMDDREPSARCG